MEIYSMTKGKRLQSFRMLEKYILQQRKNKVEVYTNDPVMKRLIESVYPNLAVGLLELAVKQPKTCEQIKPTTLSKPRSIPSDTSSTG